jgi:two-component system, cell cycle sensor histidine kinase and response regulator CckA
MVSGQLAATILHCYELEGNARLSRVVDALVGNHQAQAAAILVWEDEFQVVAECVQDQAKGSLPSFRDLVGTDKPSVNGATRMVPLPGVGDKVTHSDSIATTAFSFGNAWGMLVVVGQEQQLRSWMEPATWMCLAYLVRDCLVACGVRREQRHRELFDYVLRAANIGIWEWDIVSNTTRWSDGMESVLGFKMGHFGDQYERYLSHLDAESRAQVLAAVAACVSGEQPSYVIEHRRVAEESGEVRWVETVGRGFYDENGRATHIAGVVTDVTERHNRVSAQQQERAFLGAILDTSIMAVLVLTADAGIVYATSRAEEILGLKVSSVPGQRYEVPEWQTTDADGGPWPAEAEPFNRVLGTKLPVYGIQHGIRWPSGDVKVLRVNGAPILDNNGEVGRLVFAIDDVTESHGARRRQAELEDHLLQSQKLEGIGRLAGGIAHDFNNLLTAIMASLDLAKGSVSDGEALDMIEIAMEASERGAKLTQQLLTFAKKQLYEPRPIELNTLLRTVTGVLRRLVGERISLKVAYAEEPLVVLADPGQLEQVLVNLTVNARDALPVGGEITVCCWAESLALDSPIALALGTSDSVVFSVQDTGVGVPDDIIGRIFEPFFSTKARGQGTGLGLATCHGVVARHQGHIQVENLEAGGTRFCVHLSRSMMMPSVPVASTRELVAGGSERILLIEDDGAVLRAAYSACRGYGYASESATSIQAALALLGQQSFDLVVTDVGLPDGSGKELAQMIRELHPQIPVLVVSGYSEELMAGGLTLGPGQRFLAKPYTARQLAACVRSLLDERPAQQK